MTIRFPANADDLVTPRAGVWIEMSTTSSIKIKPTVTPRAGVWIEISGWVSSRNWVQCHSPCGSVD